MSHAASRYPSFRHSALAVACGASARPVSGLAPCAAMLLAGLSGVTLSARADAPATETVLAAVKVEASAEPVQDGALATTTRVGKVLQDPHEVPQALTSVTRAIIDQQHASTLKDALRNVSGLTFNAAEGGRSGDNAMLRGFYTFGDMYLDGVRDTAQYNRELFNLEQVDVLRGAGAMLFGRGQAGGVINQVSKTPFLRDRNKLTLAAGTLEHQEVKGDFNKRIGETSAVRLNLMKRDEGSARSNPAGGATPETHRDGVALSTGFGLGTDNELVLSHVTMRGNDRPDYGVSFVNKRPRPDAAKTYWGIYPNFDDTETNVSTLAHQYRFSPTTQLRTVVRRGKYERAYWAKLPSATLSPNATGLGLGDQTRQLETRNISVQTDLSSVHRLGGMTHEVLTGVEYLNEDASNVRLRNLAATGMPSYYVKGIGNGAPATYSGNTYSVYAQDSIEFLPHWKLLAGMRRDDLTARYAGGANPGTLSFQENSYRTGLSWQPTENAHYYLSYSNAFSPTADLYQLTGSAHPPERSQVKELGAKWQLLDGRLALRTALYQADKQWERNTDLESSAGILTRKRRTTGIEFELAGRITDRWEVFSGLALMDAKVVKQGLTNTGADADPRFVGVRARNTPPYTFNLWSTYKLDEHWTVGAGAEAKGKRTGYGQTAATSTSFVNGVFVPNSVPNYLRWDAMASWDSKRYTFRVNAYNLLNKVYYDALYDNGGFTVPGQARKVVFTAEYKF